MLAGWAARLDAARGFKIIAIVEYNGAVHNPHGLDIEALMEHRADTGFITGFVGGEDIDKKEAMFLDCDVLIPAATENQITSRTRKSCGAGFVRGRERADDGDRGRNSGGERRSS